MLESYEHEIIRKRRAARVFWILVLSFATFLYFFFQGYYPALDITWKDIFSSGGVREFNREELIRSFGIINIRTYPRDANTTVNNESFGFDEKKMVPYGKYRLSIGKPGYIQDRVRFEINRKTPYFISEVHLIPRARYERVASGEMIISKIDDKKWIARSGNKQVLYDDTFVSGSLIPLSSNPIGDGYFLSGTSIFQYRESLWEKKNWSGSVNLIKKCKDTPIVTYGYLWCMENGSALSSDGILYSGIIQIEKNYLKSKNTLFTPKKVFSLNEQEGNKSVFIENEGTWYTANQGLLIPLVSNKNKVSVPLIETTLNEIQVLTSLEGNMVIFGKRGQDTFIVFLRNGEKFIVPFPGVSLEGLELLKSNGNIFIKTNAALFFLYDGSDRIEWLTEGKILAFSDNAALYEKGGEIWRVNWDEKEE